MDQESNENHPLLPPTLPPWWRVLPCLLLLMIIATTDNLILNDFIEYRYTSYYQLNSSSIRNTRELCLNSSRISPNSTNLISTTTSKYPISTTISPNDLIQESTARLNVFIALAATIPALLTSILVGANCDLIGRKPLIALPFIGKTIRYVILTAVAYYTLSDLWIVLAVLFDSVFGTSGLSILGSFAYVSDCTNEKTRTSAIIITDVCIACSKFLPLLTIGIYLQNPNFIQSMVFILLISVGGFVSSIVLQPESNLNFQNLNCFQQLAQIKFREATKIFRVFLAKREGHKQRSLLMLVSINLCSVTMSVGNTAVFYLYLYGAPFCFDSLGVSLTSVAQTVTMILLTIPFALTVAKRTDHLSLPMLGFLLYITYLVLMGIVNQVWMIFVAAVIGATYHVFSPVIRSRITKLVEPNEYACVFILTLIFESGGSYAINAMVNEIYRISVTFYSGFVFFVLATIGALGIVLLLILYMLEYRSPVVKKTLPINE